MTIDLKPAKAEATVIPIPELREYQFNLPFSMIHQATVSGLSLKALVAAHFLLAVEENHGAHADLDVLYESSGVEYPDLWIEEGVAELLHRGLVYWYQDGKDTHYILVHDFSQIK